MDDKLSGDFLMWYKREDRAVYEGPLNNNFSTISKKCVYTNLRLSCTTASGHAQVMQVKTVCIGQEE